MYFIFYLITFLLLSSNFTAAYGMNLNTHQVSFKCQEAVAQGDWLSLQKLLQDNVTKKQKLELLCIAGQWGQLRIVKELITLGIPIDESCNGWNVLMESSAWGQKKVIKYLIESGANIYLRDHQDHTALWIAACTFPEKERTRTYECCEVLVKALLRPTLKEKQQRYCLLNCIKRQYLKQYHNLRDVIKNHFTTEKNTRVRSHIDEIDNQEVKTRLLSQFFPK